MSRGSDFVQALRPASFRGVPFGVSASRKVFGRKTAVHDYPFRDVVWVEDLGRKGRQITLTGFLVANSLIYGGGDVLAQQLALIAAVETAGPGKLIHPTLGALNVSVTGDCAINESLEGGGVLEFDLVVTEAGEKIFPSIVTATPQAVTAAAALGDAATQADAAIVIPPQLSVGALAPITASASIAPWLSAISAAGRDATNLFSLGAQLSGDFGRFFNGGNVGGLSAAFAVLLGPTSTITTLVGLAASAQANIARAVLTVQAVAANLGLGSSNNTPTDLATATQAVVATLLASTADPADAVRLLSGLAQLTPSAAANGTPLGSAIGDIVRRAAAVALARAGSTYQPASYDDANAVRATITAALDHEIDVAGDAGDDASFNALRALRVAVVQDLAARGANLAPIVTVTSAAPLPAVVLAQRLYRDASRADQLITEADCISPLFMPTSFKALAA